MNPESMTRLLKGVSRSFYLSLRILPGPMRDPAGWGYLLARSSDTLADSAGAAAALRLDCLDHFVRALDEPGHLPHWPQALMRAVTDPRERHLLENTGVLLDALNRLPEEQADLLRTVTRTITSGQRLDLQRFSGSRSDAPRSLANAAELEDYTWRVAGCVGEFWTRLAALTLGESFSNAPIDVMLESAVTYGKGLQLVNILRDVAADWAVGRCYLPVDDPRDIDAICVTHHHWLGVADEWVSAAWDYAGQVRIRRLRAASILPAILARATLQRLQEASWEQLQRHIKVPRSRVYLAFAQAWCFPQQHGAQ